MHRQYVSRRRGPAEPARCWAPPGEIEKGTRRSYTIELADRLTEDGWGSDDAVGQARSRRPF